MAAARIAAALVGDKQAREAGYAELAALGSSSAAEDEAADVAVASVGPLFDGVVGRDPEGADAAEFQRGCFLLCDLWCRNPDAVSVEIMRDKRYARAFLSPYFAATYDKPPAQLDRDDALTMLSVTAWWAAAHARPGIHAARLGTGESMGASFQSLMELMGAIRFLMPGGVPEGWRERVALLALEIIHDPDETDAWTVAGAWMLVNSVVAGHAPAITAILEAGVLPTAMATLHQSSPLDWIGWEASSSGPQTGAIFMFGWSLSMANLPGLNLAQLLLDTGFIDAAINCMKAFELRSRATETNPFAMVSAMMVLTALDLSAPEAAPIVASLKVASSALRFVIDHPIIHVEEIGYRHLTPKTPGSVLHARC